MQSFFNGLINTHIAYAAYYTIKTSRSEREHLETHHGVCKTQH